MYRNNDFIYEAVGNLENIINMSIDIESSRANYDAMISFGNTQFIVEAKSSMRTSNQGLLLSQLEKIRKNNNRPIIFIAKYISKDSASLLKERGYNYIDSSGNAFIKYKDILIYVEGQKRRTATLTNQSRAFQETGIKIIFHLLNKPENLQSSYRRIKDAAGVSLGSVSHVMTELEGLNYLMKTKEKRLLKNKVELLERWLVAYNEVLKPRIFRKKMKFIDETIANNWKDFNLDIIENYNNEIEGHKGKLLWGGETGGALLTGSLRPQHYTLFTNYEIPMIANHLRLVPDQRGNVEIYKKFWEGDYERRNVAPALLIYADLINSGYGRNVEIANQIFENELQHIQ